MNSPWYGTPQPAVDWQAWFQKCQYLEQQLQQALLRIEAMQKEINDLKSRPPIHVEYNFDQLKVSRLDGTLNIGLTPQAMQGVDSFEVPAPGMWSAPSQPEDEAAPRIRELQQEAAAYMEREAPAVIARMSEEMNANVDVQHSRMIIDDVKSQLNERVHYYARKAPYPATGTEEERNNWRTGIMEKTMKDVGTAIRRYLGNFANPPSPGGGVD
ncbi:spore germination protein GerPC [Cohnella thailandensis]|uniref:Uncharacterized protein n=1 Tax=Cohnella thailandensis TaxID=557557 RepID=A0A841SZB0_9BACL|nr:spore germination protein GerPC [Cohnella thailandensis]MBB6635565.1 hypothetical protein [Cohnella thailandensis]MBP1974945.1 spore germination protein PC [Cohnella thailandensis]